MSYTGINKHQVEDVGGWDTVIKKEEYEKLFYNQQATMEASIVDEDDVPIVPIVSAEEYVEPECDLTIAESRDAGIVKSTDSYNHSNFVTAAYGIKSPVAQQKESIVKSD